MTLPNFLVVGAAKCGTSSLHSYLRQHPDIFMPRMKDPAFFAFNNQKTGLASFPIRTRAEYEALFAAARDETAIGEVTDTYFRSRVALANIKAAIPEAKLIVSLREPVGRASSLYHMMLRNKNANAGLSFLEALAQDPNVRRGYYEPLKNFYDQFDRNRIKVVLFDDLTRDTLATAQALYGYLGVQTDFEPDLKIANPGGVPKSKWMHRVLSNARLRSWARNNLPESWVLAAKDVRSQNLDKSKMTMSEEEWDAAFVYFRDDILKTQDLIGLDLSRWMRPRDAKAA